MQVDGGAVQGHLGVAQATQQVGDRRPVDAQHVGVRDHADVGRELVAVGGEERVQMWAAALLLAFEEQRGPHRQAAMDRLPGAQRLDDAHQLALVVDGTTRHDPSAMRPVDERRLERRAAPQRDRVRGLHVVVAVVEQMRRAFGCGPVVRHDHRHPAGRPHAGVHADAGQLLRQPLRAGQRVAGTARVDPDAGEAQQLLQARDAVREGGVDVLVDARLILAAHGRQLPDASRWTPIGLPAGRGRRKARPAAPGGRPSGPRRGDSLPFAWSKDGLVPACQEQRPSGADDLAARSIELPPTRAAAAIRRSSGAAEW